MGTSLMEKHALLAPTLVLWIKTHPTVVVSVCVLRGLSGLLIPSHAFVPTNPTLMALNVLLVQNQLQIGLIFQDSIMMENVLVLQMQVGVIP